MRYKNVRVMANKWFDNVERLSGEQQEKLMQEVESLTLIGEFIGDQEHFV